MQGMRMFLSRLIKGRRTRIHHHVDYHTARGVGGWAFAHGDRRVRVQAFSGERCIAEAIAAEERVDVAAAFGDAPNSLHSGFNLFFRLPANGQHADTRVRLVVEDRDGRAVETIDGPTVKHQAIDHHIDYLTSRGVGGWVFSHADRPVRVEVWSGERCIAEVIAAEQRPDVVAAFGDAATGLHSGFNLAFTLPANDPFADVRVRLLTDGYDGAVAAIDGPQARLLTERGIQAIRERSSAEPVRSPFPRPVAGIVLALWPDAPVESHLNEDQLAVADKVLQLAAQPASEELEPLTAYVRYLREAWAHFDFVRRYFPRINKNRTAADRDFSCMPNTPEELFTIAHHLYVLKSHGAEGALAEFGCYKGYSTSMLSYACRLIGIPLHVFDSFAGLPPSDHTYAPGQFAASLDEVKSHVALYGSPEVVTFHQGFFSQALPALDVARFITLWMDVDLESSAEDVMTIFDRLDPRGAVFTHECEPRFFDGDRIVARRDAIAVIPPIVEAFERADAPARGRYLTGCTGAFWRRQGGIPVLADAAIRRLLAGI
jgi:hypothetical protein